MSYSPWKTIKLWTYLKIRQVMINYITMTMTQMTSWWWRPSDSLTLSEGVPDTWNLPRRLVLNLLICSWGAAQNWQAAGTRQGSNGRSLHGVDEGQAVGQLKGHDLSINSAERRQKRVDIFIFFYQRKFSLKTSELRTIVMGSILTIIIIIK